MEATSLSMLICGVLLSTWGNSTDDNTNNNQDAIVVAINEHKLIESIQTASLAICANISFGFRAINQKKYRSTTHETQQLDDINFLCRMMQIGATFVLIPTLLLHFRQLGDALHASRELQVTYFGIALVNSISYVTYKYVFVPFFTSFAFQANSNHLHIAADFFYFHI
jgi:hypothetical protein